MQFDKFKTGDVVQLKSGETKMTVMDWPVAEMHDHPPYEIPVAWFEGATLKSMTFHSDALVFVR